MVAGDIKRLRSDSPSLQATKTNLEREGIIVNLGQNLSLEASGLA
jgi:UDP-N-acetylmuramoylalanine--D-glutamate ligase